MTPRSMILRAYITLDFPRHTHTITQARKVPINGSSDRLFLSPLIVYSQIS